MQLLSKSFQDLLSPQLAENWFEGKENNRTRIYDTWAFLPSQIEKQSKTKRKWRGIFLSFSNVMIL